MIQQIGKPATTTHVSLRFACGESALQVAAAFESGAYSAARVIEQGFVLSATIREVTTIRMTTPREVRVEQEPYIDVYGRK
jgi:hypothetical protein